MILSLKNTALIIEINHLKKMIKFFNVLIAGSLFREAFFTL